MAQFVDIYDKCTDTDVPKIRQMIIQTTIMGRLQILFDQEANMQHKFSFPTRKMEKKMTR
jgi:hypothetical protein